MKISALFYKIKQENLMGALEPYVIIVTARYYDIIDAIFVFN